MEWKTFEHRLEMSRKSMPSLEQVPQVLVVLGSGLCDVTEDWPVKQKIRFEDIAYHPISGVSGHVGRYEIAMVDGIPTVFALGRVHLYEGYSPLEVVYGIALWATYGIKGVILTNAAGGIAPYAVGDVVVITDHINCQGTSPLVGCPYPQRFVSMIDLYERDTWELLQKRGISTGIYAGVLGPQYETPAEIQSLKMKGATLVGMSTVQEAIMSRYLGLRVCGLSVVTNHAAGLSDHRPDHNQVIHVARTAKQKIKDYVREIIHYWGQR